MDTRSRGRRGRGRGRGRRRATRKVPDKKDENVIPQTFEDEDDEDDVPLETVAQMAAAAAATQETDSSITTTPALDMEADISQLEAPTFTTLSRGPPEPMLRLQWDHRVNLLGEKVMNPMIHCCDTCLRPILIYGRMIPCKHVFCLSCAQRDSKLCPRCKDKVMRVEQTGLGTVFMCSHGGTRYGNAGCRRTYLSQRDLQAHINHRHVAGAAAAPQTIAPSKLPEKVVAVAANTTPYFDSNKVKGFAEDEVGYGMPRPQQDVVPAGAPMMVGPSPVSRPSNLITIPIQEPPPIYHSAPPPPDPYFNAPPMVPTQPPPYYYTPVDTSIPPPNQWPAQPNNFYS